MIMKYKLILAGLIISAIGFIVEFTAYAGPYGRGIYNNGAPYGGQTALSITSGGSANLSVTPADTATQSYASIVTSVTSDDVVGYGLYLRALGSTNLQQGSYAIPASANTVDGPLAVNTWGYSTASTTSFTGIKSSDRLIFDYNGVSTDSTRAVNVNYGINIDRSKPAGAYSAQVIYTAVPKTP